MTSFGLLAVAMVLVFLVWLESRLHGFIDRWLGLQDRKISFTRQEVRSRRLMRYAMAKGRERLERDKLAVRREAVVRPPIADGDPMPVDIVQWSMQETATWAQEDFKKRARELYSELQDWAKVRRILMQEHGAEADTTSTFSGLGV